MDALATAILAWILFLLWIAVWGLIGVLYWMLISIAIDMYHDPSRRR